MPSPDVAEFLSQWEIAPALWPRLDQLLRLHQEAPINLVSFSNPRELELFHLLDALMVFQDEKARHLSQARTIDVGTGGGFPGLPLALVRPHWSMTFLDSVQKKLVEIEKMAHTLDVPAHTLWGRAEDKGQDPQWRETFDLAFCRAVGRLSCVLELTLPFLKVGGFCLLHRGHEAPAEMESIGPALTKLGGTLGPLTSYGWPGLEKQRYILRIEKSHQTECGFPRRVGVPERRPL